jgi:hypothetical protein
MRYPDYVGDVNDDGDQVTLIVWNFKVHPSIRTTQDSNSMIISSEIQNRQVIIGYSSPNRVLNEFQRLECPLNSH